MLLGVGADFDLLPAAARLAPTPTTSGSQHTAVLELCASRARSAATSAGTFSAAAIWRPQATQNIVFAPVGARCCRAAPAFATCSRISNRDRRYYLGPAQRDRDLLMAAPAALARSCCWPSALSGSPSRRVGEAKGRSSRDYSLVRAAPAPRTQERGRCRRQERRLRLLPHRQRRRTRCTRSPAVVLGCTDCHGGNAGDPPARAAPNRAAPPTSLAREPGARAAALSGELALPVLAPTRSAATPCSTSRRRSSSASPTRPTIASRATAAAPAISRSSRRPSAR